MTNRELIGVVVLPVLFFLLGFFVGRFFKNTDSAEYTKGYKDAKRHYDSDKRESFSGEEKEFIESFYEGNPNMKPPGLKF